MQRHAKRTGSKVHQIQARVPADVLERLRGMHVSIELPAMRAEPETRITFKLGNKFKGSLRTRDDVVATAWRLRILEHLERLYDSARAGPVGVSQRQVEALAGDVYRLLIAEREDNPGTEAEWESFKALTRAALEGRLPGAPPITERGQSDDDVMRAILFEDAEGDALTAAIDGMPRTAETAALEQRVGRLAHWALGRRGIVVDPAKRVELLKRVALATLDAGWHLKRMAGGDYTPDPKAARFPKFESKATRVSLINLFERWRGENKPAGSTVTTWKGIVTDFVKHLGHEDAARVTDANVVAFKDKRVAAGRAAKTINDSDLACLRTLFRFAVINKLLTANPAEGIKVSAKRRAGEGRLPYTDAEIARLLVYAESETAPYRRWLPILLVTTGARVGELAQLWSDRVCVEDGVHVIRIAPAADGGTLKNEGSERTVPIHPALIASGFLDFARTREGPLFYGRSLGRGEGRHASKSATNRFASWIRTLPDFNNDRKAPSHAFRHWWKSVAVRAGIADSVADHLQGHAASGVAGRYRHFEMRTLAEAVARIQIPVLSGIDDDGAMPAGPLSFDGRAPPCAG